MKTFIVLSAVVALALAYPTSDSLPGPIREKKSASYGAPSSSLYGQASGLYGPAQAPAPAPCAASHAPAPIAFYLAPASGHLPSGLHYRADNEHEDQFESMMTSDNFDHMQARSYGGYGAAAGAGAVAGGYAVAPSSSGPAIGLFPKANIGGCAIPLLLSCAPSVTSGKLVKSGYSAPAPALAPAAAAPGYNYRSNVEDEAKMNLSDSVMEKNDHVAQWSEMERAGHTDLHAHHHHIHQHMLAPDADLNTQHNHHTLPAAFPLPSPTFTTH